MGTKQTILIIAGSVFGALSGFHILRNLFNWLSSHDLAIFLLSFPIALYLITVSILGLFTAARYKHFVAMLGFAVGLTIAYISIASIKYFGLLELTNIGLLNIYFYILAFIMSMVYMFPKLTEG